MVTTGTTGRTGVGTITIVGVIDGADRAERALNELKDAGFTPEQVSVVAKDRQDTQQLAENTDMAGEGAASGAATGGVLGGLAGFLVGISALVIPGIGPIVGTGILLSTLAGAGIGAVAGGLAGALTAWGFSEAEVREYEARVAQGDILVAVEVPDEVVARVEEMMHGAGAIRFGSGSVRR